MSRANTISLLLWLSAIALVAWILKDLPVESMLRGIEQLHFSQWIVWIVLNLLVVALSTLRWHALIGALKGPVSFFALVLIRLAGQTVSFVTPGPQFGGEPLQIYWLYKREGIALHKTVLALGLDRFFELWVNFAVLLFGTLLLFLSPRMAFADWNYIVLVLFAMLLIMPAFLIALMRRPQWITRRLRPLVARWLTHPRLTAFNSHRDALEEDLRELLRTRKRVLVQALVISIFTWVFILTELWLLLFCARIHVDLQGFVLIAVAIRIAMLLPLPGGIGTIEAALVWSTQMIGFSLNEAILLIGLMRMRDCVILIAGVASLVALRNKPNRHPHST